MKKLTAEECRILIDGLSGNRSIREDKYLAALEIALPVLEQQEKGNDGWVEWGGGKCPVKANARVEVMLRCSMIETGKAKWFDWSSSENSDDEGDIIAYRVIENDRREG